MNAHLLAKQNLRSCKGFSVLDLLIAAVVILVVVSYAVSTMVHGQKPALRTSAAQQFVNYLQRARDDSMRRRATASPQMAQVTILNDKYYCVRMDGNGDGALDMPIVISIVEQPVTMNGPFPRTFMFDSVGKPVDSNAAVIEVSPITFTNSSGTSTIKISDNGRAVMEKP